MLNVCVYNLLIFASIYLDMGINIIATWGRMNVYKRGSKTSRYHMKSAKSGLQRKDLTKVTERELPSEGVI